ncbi:prolipoprotein diacylglyceryl transferase [Apilactobacillus ozensis]|uniref:Phosphatidylglycerol--prolipoprotein diacylglyceryl transferase n=1 Tax=Apilactobacillus ozensis DSM 23829 = JCM 17196 TaxID=1423781 RepID=A0A0R2ARL5_9LACO|nr:prolipoprotein diacylglyceryl transferase [Apilactobacillus ozensis]KRM69479.1 prolipoprotein diacylglyceryl transferase [Apilactobacillus ozensis DSM 23829 = JCM 17196]MCK8607721.1 prolipoprotein diacylglyceryl transferase [Apilactobacillus ozensis]
MAYLALNPIAVRIGSIEVHWYGIFIASAVMLAVYLSIVEGKKHGIKSDNIYDMILLALPTAVICARIYYVAFQWNYYQYHLDEIIRIWDGGIAIYGALIGAAIVVYLYCRNKFIPVWLMLDVIAPTVILGQAIGRWGNFMNQEAFGQITSLSFLNHLHLPHFIIQQMFIQGAYRQPTFLYESIWDLLGFVLLMNIRHMPNFLKRGETTLLYIIWYAFGRFFVEGMRTDSLVVFYDIRISQILSFVLFFAAIGLLIYRRKNYHDLPLYIKDKAINI